MDPVAAMMPLQKTPLALGPLCRIEDTPAQPSAPAPAVPRIIPASVHGEYQKTPSAIHATPISAAVETATIPIGRMPGEPAASSATRSAAIGTRSAITSAQGAHGANASAPAAARTAATAETDAARAGSGGRNATTQPPSTANAHRPRTAIPNAPSCHHHASSPASSRDVGKANMMVARTSAQITTGRTKALPMNRRELYWGNSAGAVPGSSSPKSGRSSSNSTARTPVATTDPSALKTARTVVAADQTLPSTLNAWTRESAPRCANIRRRSASKGPVRLPANRTNQGPAAERPRSSCPGFAAPEDAPASRPLKSSNSGSSVTACPLA